MSPIWFRLWKECCHGWFPPLTQRNKDSRCLPQKSICNRMCTYSLNWLVFAKCLLYVPDSVRGWWDCSELAWWMTWHLHPAPPWTSLQGYCFLYQGLWSYFGNIKSNLYPHLTYSFEGKETGYKVRQNGKSNIKEVAGGIRSEGEWHPPRPRVQWVHGCGCFIQRKIPLDVMWTLTTGWKPCYMLEAPTWREQTLPPGSPGGRVVYKMGPSS